MNTIKRSVYGISKIQERLNINAVNLRLNDLYSELEAKAYEQGELSLLVNSGRIDMNMIDISSMEYGEDYHILTSEANIYDEEAGAYIEFKSEEDYLEYYRGKGYDDEDIEDWWDFANYSEIYWNKFYRFNDCDVDIEVANKIGLPVIELNNGDTYLSISGCGMDMSFQIIRYQALAHGQIDESYATNDSLEWCKSNMSEKNFKEMLSKLGVSIDNLEKRWYS